MTTPDRHPLWRLFDPRDRFGGYALPPLAIILIVVGVILAFALGFVSGWQSRPVYDAHFFRQHYNVARQHIPIPPKGSPIPVRPRAIPAAGSINLARYPAVGDQGTLGACAAWATAWDVSYEWRMLHPTSWLRFSPRQMYDHYSDVYNGGQDGGSWPDADVEISGTTGLLQFKMLPEPPYVIDDPIPTYDAYGHLTATDAAKHRFPTTTHPLGPITMGGGQGLVDNIEVSIAAGHPTLIAIPVYPEFDNATQTNGLIGMPQSGEGSRGGHEIVAVAYQPNMRFPDGYVGTGIEVVNQWNTWWGVQGRGWLEDRFVAQYVFGAEWIGIGTSTPAAKTAARKYYPPDGGNAPHAPLHPATGSPPKGGSSDWVRPFYTRDSHVDISPTINAAASYYNLPATFLLGVIMAESGGNQYAARYGVWPDVSFGLTQVTVSTLTGYYNGCGNNIPCARSYLFDYKTSIWLGARILRAYWNDYHVPPPSLWQCFNSGSYCASPYYAGFLSNYYVALTYAGGTPPSPPQPPTPKKTKFGKLPARVWGQFRKEHGLSLIPHKGWYAHHWRTHDFRHAGGIVQHERYDAKRRVMFEVLQGGYAWWRPGAPGVTWQGHDWMR